MRADVAVAERAEDGVDQRMQHDVGVGMSLQPAIMRNADAAEHDMIAVAEGVNVEAHAGADVVEQRGARGRSLHEILRRGQFDIAGFAREGGDGKTRPIPQARRRR